MNGPRTERELGIVPVKLKVPFGMGKTGVIVHRTRRADARLHDDRLSYYAHWECSNSSPDAVLLAEVGDRDMCYICKYAQQPLVYRFYDVAVRVIYIGATDSFAARQQAHERSSEWWPDVASIRLERFPTYSHALVAERRAIRAERPVHNIAHNLAYSGKVRAA